ncbi:MAG: hypothetical protein KKD73_07385 [Proteobacteria bacterium]|nr:hypothetical protein [Pseudomonadota bacterium]MBU1639162.1 hypothetical protein [Pseudomonadota bacterium]
MKSYLALLILAVSFLIGCTQTITPEMLPLAESLQPLSAEETEGFGQGRQNFIDKCSGCHFHMYPSQYTPRKWKFTMREHIGSTNLTKVEYQQLIDYIVRASELSHSK